MATTTTNTTTMAVFANSGNMLLVLVNLPVALAG